MRHLIDHGPPRGHFHVGQPPSLWRTDGTGSTPTLLFSSSVETKHRLLMGSSPGRDSMHAVGLLGASGKFDGVASLLSPHRDYRGHTDRIDRGVPRPPLHLKPNQVNWRPLCKHDRCLQKHVS